MKNILPLLVSIVIITGCNKDCDCTGSENISLVYAGTYKYQESNVQGYFPEYYVDGPCELYWHNINSHTIEYCSNSNFTPTDSTQLVIGKWDLTAVNQLPYIEKPWEGYPVLSINAISGDGVIYYRTGFEIGRLPIGNDTCYEIVEIDTIPWGFDSMFTIDNQIIYDESQEVWLYQDWYSEMWKPVPDTNFVTTTYSYYISNVGLFELEDFIDFGSECYCI